MGLYAHYWRVSPFELQRIQDDPAAADALFGYDLEEDDDVGWDEYIELRRTETVHGRYLDIGKMWHVLHFVLTGDNSYEAAGGEPPLRYVVLGSDVVELGAEATSVYMLRPIRVQEVSQALHIISRDAFRLRLDAEAINAADLYPLGAEWEQEDLAYLLDIYDQVTAFFHAAAEAGDGILIQIC